MDSASRAENRECIRERSTFDHFVDEVSAKEGLSLVDLEPLTTLHVSTVNSRYRIMVLDGPTIRVQGGRLFPEITVADLSGSSFGDGPLKFGWIGVGMRMEIIRSGGRRLVTSPVRAITIEQYPTADRPQEGRAVEGTTGPSSRWNTTCGKGDQRRQRGRD